MGTRLARARAIVSAVVTHPPLPGPGGFASGMALVREGLALPLTPACLRAALPKPTRRVVLLVHGLTNTEAVWGLEDGTDFGTLLARDRGLTPLYLRYDSGLPIADNGAALALLLERLLEAYPVRIEELVLLGYSMGGLVLRSACHVASAGRLRWLPRVRRAIYLGTPHLGTPWERMGCAVTELLGSLDHPSFRFGAQLARLRSQGIRDLGWADLRHEDRARSAARLEVEGDTHPVPLLPSIDHRLIAGTLGASPWVATLLGDALVPLESATNGACATAAQLVRPPAHVRIVRGVGHLELPRHPEVYRHVRAFTAPARRAKSLRRPRPPRPG